MNFHHFPELEWRGLSSLLGICLVTAVAMIAWFRAAAGSSEAADYRASNTVHGPHEVAHQGFDTLVACCSSAARLPGPAAGVPIAAPAPCADISASATLAWTCRGPSPEPVAHPRGRVDVAAQVRSLGASSFSRSVAVVAQVALGEGDVHSPPILVQDLSPDPAALALRRGRRA